MKKTIKFVSMLTILILSQLMFGFSNTVYAISDIVFDHHDGFNRNILSGVNVVTDYYSNGYTWHWGDMDHPLAPAKNKNSLGHTSGYYPSSGETGGKTAIKRQVVDLRSIADRIDNEEIYFRAQVDMGNNATAAYGTDEMWLIVTYYDIDRDPINGLFTIKDNIPSKTWLNDVTVGGVNGELLPIGTRYVEYEMRAKDSGTNGVLALLAHQRLHFFDKTAPTVKTVTMTTNAEVVYVNGTATRILKSGDDMDFIVEFSEPVDIGSNLGLNLKFSDDDSAVFGRASFYHNPGDIIAGDTKYIFHGEVPADVQDGMKLSLGDIITLNSEPEPQIDDFASNSMSDFSAALSGRPVMIDSYNPEIESIESTSGNGTFTAGETIEFNTVFSEAVKVVSNHKLIFNNGAADAKYQSGSGTDTLYYTYTVADGNNIEGLRVTGLSGTVEDITGKSLIETIPDQSYSINIDTIPPNITFTDAEGSNYDDKSTYKRAHDVYITVTDDVSGWEDTYYYWDTSLTANDWDSAKGIANGTVPVVNPENATGDNYYLHSKATDKAGNVSIETEGPFCFDNEKPTITIDPESGTNQTSYDVMVTAEDEKNGIKEINYTWYRKIDDENSEKLNSGTIESGSIVTSPDMDGIYTVTVEAEDDAGNMQTKISGEYIVDKSPPTVVFSSEGNSTVSGTVSVEVTISDSSPIKNAYYQWSESVIKPAEDDSQWTEFFVEDILNPVSSYTGNISSGDGKNGVWYLHVKCEDASGSISIYTTQDGFNLDNEKPELSFSPNGNSNPQQVFTTYLEVNNESFGYTVKYDISTNIEYDDTVLTEYILNGDDITFTLDDNTGSNITDTYYIHVKVEDTAGNVSVLSSNPIYIDNTPPCGSIDLNKAYTNQSSVQLMLSASDVCPEGADENILMRISPDGGTTWNGWAAYSQAQNITLTEEKEYSIAVQYKDIAGNESEVYTAQIIYDITSPEIDNIQYNNEWTNEDLPVTIYFSDMMDSENIDIEVIDDETTAEVTVENNVITFKENGICKFIYRDLAGNENTDSITISNFDKIAPEISLSPDGNSDENQSVTVDVSAADNVTSSENIDIYYCWSQSSNLEPDNWNTCSNGIIEKNDGSGKWYLWIKAEDGLSNSSLYTSKAYNLDNENPEVINIAYIPSSATANNVTARVDFDENVRIASPIQTSEYANNFEYVFEDNGTQEIIFVDKAGNENSIVLEVDWIDRSKPGAHESYIPDSWTNESVAVTVTTEEENCSLYDFKLYIGDSRAAVSTGSSISAVAECVYNWNNDTENYLLSGNDDVPVSTGSAIGIDSLVSLTDVTVNDDGAVTQVKFLFGENGYMSYKIKRVDTLISGDGEITVDKIDKEKPIAELIYTSKNYSWHNEDDAVWTNDAVQVILEASDNSGQPVEILNNGGSNKYIFEDNGSFAFEICDAAGNKDTVNATVRTIDKESPEATVVYTSGNKSWNTAEDEKWTNENVEVTIKTTDNSGQPVEILNNDGSNKYIIEENRSFTFKIRDAAGNESEITVKASKIDKEMPNPVITYNTQEWTNEDVTVSIAFDNETEAVTILNNGGSTSYKFTENGAFTFQFEDAAGNNDEITVVVNNIDKAAPQVDELWYSTTEPTNGKVRVKVYVNETVKFSTDNGEDNYTFGENGSHEFRFIDKAGNESSITAEVSNIDREEPNVWIEYSTVEVTKNNVVATLMADEKIYVINNINKNQYVFTENGTFTFIYEDLAGNGGEITATVANIDAASPNITLELSETEPTQNDVTVTITSDKEITPVNYTGNTVVFTENGIKWLKALDSFDEEFYFRVEVGNIDREVPKIEFSKGENLVIAKSANFDPLSDVIITDNLDEEISGKLNVTHNVDVNTEGEYLITYTASDSAGNSVNIVRTVKVVNPDEFTVFINTSEAKETEIVTEGKGISLELFGIEGNHIVKWLKGKKNKGDFKECEVYCEGGYLQIEESGYYTLLIQDQERNTKLLNVYVIHSN